MSARKDTKELPPGTKVWRYARHSPGDNQTIESQLAALNQFQAERGWITERTFTDQWVSGDSTEGREEFQRMTYLAKQRSQQASVILVLAYDRFARNTDDAIFHRAELRKHGWEIVSIQDEIPSGPMARFAEALIDFKNEQFLTQLKANTIRGLEYIAAQGCLPNGQITLGYKGEAAPLGGRTKDGMPRMGRKPIVDPDIEVHIQKAFELKAQGASNSEISKQTKQPGLFEPKPGSWNQFFRNRNYVGEYVFHGRLYTNIYPRIISDELFDEVQKRMPPKKERQMAGRNHPRRKRSTFFLASISFCKYCQNPMEGKSVGKGRWYVCSQHNTKVSLCPQSGLIPAKEVESQIVNVIREQVLDTNFMNELQLWTEEHVNKGIGYIELRMKNLTTKCAVKQEELKTMTENFLLMKKMPESASNIIEERECELKALQMELMECEREYDARWIEFTPEQIEKGLIRAHKRLDQAVCYDLREICEQMISRIIMSRDVCDVEIHFPEGLMSRE